MSSKNWKKAQFQIFLVFMLFPHALLGQTACPPKDTISLDTIPSGHYKAVDTIVFNTVLQEDATVLATAGNAIRLLPGFHALAGTQLSTGLYPCESENSLQENVIVTSEATNDHLIALTPNTIVFSETAPQIDLLLENCIAVSDITANAPNGYLRKIVSVEHNNGEVILTTESAKLVDAVGNMDFSFQGALEEPTAEAARAPALPIHVNLADLSISDELALSGHITIQPDFVFDLTNLVDLDEPMNFKMGMVGTIDYNIGVVYSPVGDLNYMEEKELYSKGLRPIPIRIPIPLLNLFPINVRPELELKLIAELNGPAIEFAYKGIGTFQAVVRKIGDEWINDNNNDFVFSGSFDPAESEFLSGALKLRMELDLDFYDAEEVEIFAFAEGEVGVAVTEENCTIDPIVRVGGGLEIDALEYIGFEDDKISVSYDFEFDEIVYDHTPPNYAMEFDGTDDQVVSSSSTSLYASDYTIECWARFDNLGKDNFLVEIGEILPDRWIWKNGDFFRAGMRNDTLWYDYYFYAPVVAGEWNHVACTYDYSANEMRFYINGQSVGGAQSGGILPGNEGNPRVWVGRQITGSVPNNRLEGAIDEVRYWNYARSAAQIQTNYDRELTGNESGLMTYYKFNAPNSTCADVIDCSGSGRHAVRGGSGGANPKPFYAENDDLLAESTLSCTETCDALASQGPEVAFTSGDAFELISRTRFKVFPNPARKTINLAFSLSESREVHISIYSMRGERIRTIANAEHYDAGSFVISVDDIDLTAGMYYVLLRTGEEMLSRKLVVLGE